MFDFLTSSTSVLSSSTEETRSIGKEFALSLTPGSIVCLDGDLGAGKTTFAQGLIQALSSLGEELIQSPTFIFLNIYPSTSFSICHFDLYRMKHSEEFEQRGFLDYFDDNHICLIEWPCKIPELLPKEALYVHITHINDSQRMITFQSWGNRCL